MAIMAYVGIPGSGKSYEVVNSVILEHYKKGRRIVTNIEGISDDKLRSYCETLKDVDVNHLGQLIKVSDEDCQRDDFFPYKGSQDTICRAGDLICLDEIWRIFPNDNIKPNHRSFVAEHRHFTDPETGICCDLVVINQSVTGIPRFIKDRIETTFSMSRLTALGLGKRYRVNVYSGSKTTKSMLVTQYQNKYKKEIFNLYKSFDGVNGKQKTIDDRQNYFKSGQFRMSVFAIVGFFGVAYYFLGDYINTDPTAGQQTKTTQSKQAVKKSEVKNYQDLTPEERLLNKMQDEKDNATLVPEELSSVWRITGELEKNSERFVILSDDKGNLRFEPKKYFNGEGRALTGFISGKKVGYYSGVKDEKGLL